MPPSRACTHYWRLNKPHNGIVRGRCLRCQARYRREEPITYESYNLTPVTSGRRGRREPVATVNDW